MTVSCILEINDSWQDWAHPELNYWTSALLLCRHDFYQFNQRWILGNAWITAGSHWNGPCSQQLPGETRVPRGCSEGKDFETKKCRILERIPVHLEKFIKKWSLTSKPLWKQGHKTLFKDSKFFCHNVLSLWSVVTAWELLWQHKRLLFSSSQYYTRKIAFKKGKHKCCQRCSTRCN